MLALLFFFLLMAGFWIKQVQENALRVMWLSRGTSGSASGEPPLLQSRPAPQPGERTRAAMQKCLVAAFSLQRIPGHLWLKGFRDS